MPESFPAILFGTVCLLAAGTAILTWSTRRGLAWISAGLAAFAALCWITNQLWARYSIRVDLLMTIPLVSAGGLTVGILAARRGGAAGRAAGALLGACGGLVLAWSCWDFAAGMVQAGRLTATFDEGVRLYWQETNRCQANFEKRFGPLRRRDAPCYGNLVVKSRGQNSYPFTRVIINDYSQAYLLFSPRNGVENTIGLSNGPFAQMKEGAGGLLSGKGDSGLGPTSIDLKPAPDGGCQAEIARPRYDPSRVTLSRTELPACEAAANPSVHLVAILGTIVPDPPGSQYRRLTQIWLWQTPSRARGLLVTGIAAVGMRIEFNFVRFLRGTATGRGQWELTIADTGEKLTLRPEGGGHTRLTGPTGTALLDDEDEVVSDPRIALTPLWDAVLFDRYFDAVFFNLSIPWTAQDYRR